MSSTGSTAKRRGRRLRFAVTTGEPAGIGPDITAAALAAVAGGAEFSDCDWIVFGDAALLRARAESVGVADRWQQLVDAQAVKIEAVALAAPVIAGTLDVRNAAYLLDQLTRATDGCLAGDFDALITAPLQKSLINDAGVAFTGHTEFLAQRAGAEQVVMMLAGPQAARDGRWLRVALATTHLPLAQVPAAITTTGLLSVLRVVDTALKRDFGIARPSILVTGLNPHAGEGGHLGREEIDAIAPALAAAQAAGIDARGPYPADTLFQPRHLDGADCVLAMYHDQGLAPLKYATFGAGVNITLGLPLIRTSVDHGTALDLAATGRADCGSMIQALTVAAAMARTRTALA